MGKRSLHVGTAAVLSCVLGCASTASGELIAWWTFDEGAGSVATDVTGNGHDLSLQEGAGWAAGVVGPGALDTRLGYATAPHASELELAGSYTIAMWTNKDNDDPGVMTTIVSKHWCSSNDDGSWALQNRCGPDGNIHFIEFVPGLQSIYWTGGSSIGGVGDMNWGDVGVEPTFTCAAWDHVAITYDAQLQQASLYNNGVLVRQGPWTSGLGGSVAPLVVGTDHLLPGGGLCGSNHFYPGNIDDVRIYDHALSDAEIMTLVDSPPAPELIPLETIDVPATYGTPITSTVVLEAGETYWLLAEGTYTWGPSGEPADAEWTIRDKQFPDDWFETFSETPMPDDVLDVYVDGQPVDWRGFMPVDADPILDFDMYLPHVHSLNHSYWLPIDGTGDVLSLHTLDTGYTDNSGSLSVTIFAAELPTVDPLTVLVPDDFTSIQDAIDAVAEVGVGTITVEPGTYQEQIDIVGGDITLKTVAPDNPDAPATIIWAGPMPTGPVVTIRPGVIDSVVTIDGFVIQGGIGDLNPFDPTERVGGGVYVLNSGVVIRRCTITGNGGFDTHFGGGLYALDSMLMIDDCEFEQNTVVHDGGAMYLRECDAVVDITDFQCNSARFGGAVLNRLTDGMYVACMFDSNWAIEGGAVYNLGASPSFSACDFMDNAARDDESPQPTCDVGAGLLDDPPTPRGGAMTNDVGAPLITGCLFTGNTASSPATGGWGGAIASVDVDTNPLVTECDFTDNTATFGGAIASLFGSGTTIIGGTMTGNTVEAGGAGGGIFVAPTLTGAPAVENSRLELSLTQVEDVYNLGGFTQVDTLAGAGEIVNIGRLEPGVGGPFAVFDTMTLPDPSVFRQTDLGNGQVGSGTTIIEIGGTVGGVSHDFIDFDVFEGGGELLLVIDDDYQPGAEEQFLIASYDEFGAPFSLVRDTMDPATGMYLRIEYSDVTAGSNGTIRACVENIPSALAFGVPDSYGVDDTPSELAVGDFDGANGLDLALVLSPDVKLFFNGGINGDGDWAGFIPGPQIYVGSDPTISVADLNGVGGADIAIASADGVQVLLDGGVTPINVGPPASGIAAVDIDGAGPADLAVIRNQASSFEVTSMVNDGTGLGFTIGQVFSYPDAGQAQSAQVARVTPGDLDNDKDVDDDDDDLLLLVSQLTLVDPEGDGIPEPLHAWGVISLTGAGGNFASNGFQTLGIDANEQDESGLHMIVADMDADGHDDALVTNPIDEAIVVVPNAGDAMPGVMLGSVPQFVDGTPASIAVVDFDRDGDRDVVAVVVDAESGAGLTVLRNLMNDVPPPGPSGGAQLQFSADADALMVSNPLAVFAADVDGDLFEDVIAVTPSGAPFAGGGPMPTTADVLLNTSLLRKGDTNGDDEVDVEDLVNIFVLWATDGRAPGVNADIVPDGEVDVDDLVEVIMQWD